MPFESDAQRRFMHAKHPKIARRWEKHTPKGKDLPEKKAGDAALEATFVRLFKQAVYRELAASGMTMDTFCRTALAEALVKNAEPAVSGIDRAVDALGLGTPKGRMLAGVVSALAFAGGGVGGALAAKLTRPSNDAIENLEREELMARYNDAIASAKSRISTRQARLNW